MNIEKRLMQYYKRWNIEFPYEEQFSKFKNRIITVVDELMESFLVANSNPDKKIFLRLLSSIKPMNQRSKKLNLDQIVWYHFHIL